MIGPGMKLNAFMRKYWTPRENARWLSGTHLQSKWIMVNRKNTQNNIREWAKNTNRNLYLIDKKIGKKWQNFGYWLKFLPTIFYRPPFSNPLFSICEWLKFLPVFITADFFSPSVGFTQISSPNNPSFFFVWPTFLFFLGAVHFLTCIPCWSVMYQGMKHFPGF